jgi:hypothetical protein
MDSGSDQSLTSGPFTPLPCQLLVTEMVNERNRRKERQEQKRRRERKGKEAEEEEVVKVVMVEPGLV